MQAPQTLRTRAAHALAEVFFRGLSAAGKLHPLSRPARHGVTVLRDVPYLPGGRAEQRLDIYLPSDRSHAAPVVLYMHGGAFRMLSKETHWIMGLLFARAGFVVCNVSYRLAPRFPFPAALEDTADAFVWLTREVARYGGDPQRVVLAGESAGGNLAAALSVATCYERPEPYAVRVFETGVVPRAVIIGCGILQVSDPERFARRRPFPSWIHRALSDIRAGYLGDAQAETELADPLLILERGQTPARPLPPIFAFVGTKDPLLDDTRRLASALLRLGVPHRALFYPGQLHAFHALPLLPAARAAWRETFTFLERYVDPNEEGSAVAPS